MNFITVLGQLASIVIAILTVPLWLETRRQRQALKKPLLLPSKLNGKPEISGILFSANFSFPRVDDYKHTGLVYLGVKNVGSGPAMCVQIDLFQPGVGTQTERGNEVYLPEGQTAPLLLRFGYDDPVDALEEKPHRVAIRYSDIFGDKFSLQMDLWFRNLEGKDNAEAILIQYSTEKKPMPPAWIPIFRGMEYQGYFELDKLFERNEKTTK